MRGKVILFYPPYDGPPLSAPLCLLSLAASLRDAGFKAIVIDAAIDPHYREAVLRELPTALCIGISVLTGPMILGAIDIATAVKKLNPDLPVIFGGWHPSLLPDQTLQAPFVDMVVRGQGDLTLVEVAEALADGQSFDNIAGLSWKDRGLPQHNPERRVQLLETLPTPAFDLVDFDAYAKQYGVRKLAYATSLGCPYACNYCTDMVFYKRRFNTLSAERVVGELASLVPRHAIEEVALLDSNFPVDLHRAIRIAQGIVESRVKFRWTFQASTDFLCRMRDDEVRLLGESGVSHMGFGTESTSEPVLKLMNKRHQRVDEMFETARKAAVGNILVTFNLIFGYPGETEADRITTFRTMTEIAREFSNVNFSPNVFTPYPGIPIWPQLRELGVREPASLREWASLPLGANILPWLQGNDRARLDRMLNYFLLHNQICRKNRSYPLVRRMLRRAVLSPIRWRLRSSRYSFPWELWLAQSTEPTVQRRSLVTGQPLPKEAEIAC